MDGSRVDYPFNKEHRKYLVDTLSQIEEPALRMGFKPETIKELTAIRKTHLMSLPVELDGGRDFVWGYRIWHFNPYAAGIPFKGGIEAASYITKDLIAGKAVMMTAKCAAVGLNEYERIPFGGSKGGIALDLKSLRKDQREKIWKAYVKELGPLLGPRIDVPAPDYGTNTEDMRYLQLAFGEFHRWDHTATHAVVTGKPIDEGGCPGREIATGAGLLFVLKALMEFSTSLDFQNLPPCAQLRSLPETPTILIQGMGNVGGALLRLADHFPTCSLKIVGIAEIDGGIYNPKGIEVHKLLAWMEKQNTRSPVGYPEADSVKTDEFFSLPADILAPCAKENVITEENANRIKAKIILEGANGPTTKEADAILNGNGVVAIADILANAGGVTVSYFEWLSALRGDTPSREKVMLDLQRYMEGGVALTLRAMQKYNLATFREGAWYSATEYLGRQWEAKHLR